MIKMKYYYYKNNEDKFIRVIGTYDKKNKTVLAEFRSDEPKNFKKIRYGDYLKNEDNFELIIGSYDETDKTVAVMEKEIIKTTYTVVAFDDCYSFRYDSIAFNAIVRVGNTDVYRTAKLNGNIKSFTGDEYIVGEETFDGLDDAKAFLIDRIKWTISEYGDYLERRMTADRIFLQESLSEHCYTMNDLVELYGDAVLPGTDKYLWDDYRMLRELIKNVDEKLKTKTDFINHNLDEFYIVHENPVEQVINI